MKFYTNVQIYRDEILLRGYEDGERIQRSIPYTPYLFEPNKVYRERGIDTPYKTIRGEPVYKIEFDTIRDARNYIKETADISNKRMYGLTNFQYTFINDYYPGTIDYDPKLISIVTLDIEVSTEGGFPDIDKADKTITAITLRKKGQSIVLGMKPYNNSDSSVTYIKCNDEHDMLEKFLTIWQSKQYAPDVLTGWNVEFFDIPYIVNRIRRIMGESAAKRLSPWGILETRELEIMGRNYVVYTPLGISIIDYLQAYRKFSFAQQESFKLDNIANNELGERKLDYS
jgi:DNA polymerase elongation subunit (family B)